MSGQQERLRQRVALTPARLRDATDVIVEHHYLHRGRTMAQVAYWIGVDGNRSGVLLFALPRLSVPFHGYHPMTLIELARLWLDPAVQGRCITDHHGRQHSEAIAGCAVGAALRQIRGDWKDKYPHLPDVYACVAWADQSLHRGTVYLATNFQDVGAGGGRMPGRWTRPGGGQHKQHADYRRRKTAFLYRWQQPPPRAHVNPARPSA